MYFFNKQPQKDPIADDRLASVIAEKIIRVQRKASGLLNKQLNRYSRDTQLRWLWLFCAMAAIVILFSMLMTTRKQVLPHFRPTFVPAHIGQSSAGLPGGARITTDSLNHQ